MVLCSVLVSFLIVWSAVSCKRAIIKEHQTIQSEQTTVPIYTDEELVNAIYKAEGGDRAAYLYGIRSCHYSTPEEARRICFNTVRNNRQRYADYGHAHYATYLEFLASRYCPTEGKGLTEHEKRVNVNWLPNVKYFLKQGRKNASM